MEHRGLHFQCALMIFILDSVGAICTRVRGEWMQCHLRGAPASRLSLTETPRCQGQNTTWPGNRFSAPSESHDRHWEGILEGKWKMWLYKADEEQVPAIKWRLKVSWNCFFTISIREIISFPGDISLPYPSLPQNYIKQKTLDQVLLSPPSQNRGFYSGTIFPMFRSGGWPQLAARHTPSQPLSCSLSQQVWKETKMKKFVVQDKDREITFQLSSWAKQAQLGENQFNCQIK